MRGKQSLFYHILIFVIAQLVWLSLLGLWIYWYVSNYIIFEKVGDQVSPQLVYDVQNAIPFILGLILLVGLSFITALIFRHLNVQLRITQLYDNFISNVTHELKSPLSSIQLYLETLRQRNVPAEKQKEFISMIVKDTDRLQSLINSILEISAQEKNKQMHDYQIYRSGDIVKGLLEESFEKFRVKKESYSINGDAPCEILAGKDSLKIIFDNLIDNAVKYSIANLIVEVNLSCNANKFTVEFSDNGIGISAKEHKKIFNKFYRIYNRDIPNVKGTGLGLYRVKEIVKAHGGNISVTSDSGKIGTIFKIEMPVYHHSKKRFFKGFLNKKQEITNGR
ncbi:MAG: HAMP domain-containing histidine kinase [Ignavibacteria bacterium]|nr:HAMP domain-containing histidine kinase [Ignavibacteria bacterium]MBT8383533.1 HAMP domain-containing histidine kinase [Ignavibacteria bacterium]MBT8390500.1 HAMP domain-containing histidine kinase [Ignavibacteria bacterium]NNJ52570.1 HAMP domain-containing histidine kinase [Ignavibacteriaceae bacterium]NNL20035.1 HAMP domain-containing histidine kinase [Ignavibacteriaceae bacterium]